MRPMKRCSHCRRRKVAVDAFNRNASTKDGFQSWCRECIRRGERATRCERFDGTLREGWSEASENLK